jgi:molecular chaperone DnaK
MAQANRTLGRFHLVGIPPAPRGLPQVEVTFDIDANGIVSVAAKDRATGKEQKITISGTSGLNKDEVSRMVADAEQHAADDKGRRELIDARNQADALAYQVEKALNENRERLATTSVAHIETAIDAVRNAMKGEDLNALRRATDELQRSSHAMAEELYKRGPSGANQPQPEPSSGVKEGEVIDAEYVGAEK